MASLRIKDLQRLNAGRYPNGIPNDPAGHDFVVVMAHHLASLPRDPRQTIAAFLEQHASWMTIAEQKALIVETISKPRRWRADSLAWRLRLIDADRTALKITTIGAIDVDKSQRAKRRARRSAERSRQWRMKQKCT